MLSYLPAQPRRACDARALGARCDECPLKRQRPVAPEPNSSRLVVLGESPGEHEEDTGRPFVGASGRLLNRMLSSLGHPRDTTHVTNAILCRPTTRMRSEDWDKALECCRPRLLAELTAVPDRVIIAFGTKALQTLTGKAKITPWLGAPLYDGGFTIIPSYHPAFALRKPGFIPIVKTYLSRAIAFARGVLRPWQWPRLIVEPPYAPFLEELSSATDLSVDIENLPDTDRIRCIGVGSGDLAVSVPLPPEGRASPDDLLALRKILAGPATKILQNGQHDRLALERAGWTLNGPFWDTMLAHAIVAPRLPHDLGFICSVETHAPRWKTEFHIEGDDKGSNKRAKRFALAPLSELLPYNAKDNIGQALLKPALSVRLDGLHRGWELFETAQQLDDVSMRMRRRGLMVDQSKLAGHRATLTSMLDQLRKQFYELGVDPGISLGKNGQNRALAQLFFEKFRAPVVSRNKETGAASLDSKALTYYVGHFTQLGAVPIANIARTIIRYRKYAKLLGSYIDNLPIESDGCVHPIWRIFGTRTGRWSSTEPAIQTIPKPNKSAGTPGMRDLFCSRLGMWLVEADYSQLELRIVALLSGDPLLIEWYANGVDVHTLNAKMIWPAFDQMPKDRQKQMRDLAKRVVYGMNYGGSAETIWKSLVVDFPNLRITDVQYVMKQWFKAHPRIADWQKQQVITATKNNYVEAPLSGRRQYYHDGRVSPTEVLNFPIQATAGDVANRAVLSIAKKLDWEQSHLLLQVHDSLTVEGPDRELLAAELKSAMEQRIELNGATVTFPVDVSWGTNWGHMEKAA